MKLKLDENLGNAARAALEAAGHDVSTVPAQGLQEALDNDLILPDLSAGCSMADMAHIDQLEVAWPILEECADIPITPITYVNSSAAIKAFVGAEDGACCTSSNAKMVLEWALHGATGWRSATAP